MSGESSAWAKRDVCDSRRKSVDNTIHYLETAQALREDVMVAAHIILEAGELVELLGVAALGPETVVFASAFGLVYLLAIATCEAYETCGQYPEPLVEAGKVLITTLEVNSAAAAALGMVSTAAESAVLEQMIEPMAYSVGAAHIAAIAASQLAKILLDAALDYYRGAQVCCAFNCESAVCQQASMACSMTTGTFWADRVAGERGLNCAAE